MEDKLLIGRGMLEADLRDLTNRDRPLFMPRILTRVDAQVFWRHSRLGYGFRTTQTRDHHLFNFARQLRLLFGCCLGIVGAAVSCIVFQGRCQGLHVIHRVLWVVDRLLTRTSTIAIRG